MAGYQSTPVQDPNIIAPLMGQFRFGIDEVSLTSVGGAAPSAYWEVEIPPDSTPAALLSRVIESFEGGGITYKVFTNPVAPAPVYAGITLPPINAQVKFRRVTSGVTDEGSTPNDLDWIVVAGTGNNTVGGAAGGQAVRPQPGGVKFYLKMTNTSNVGRTCRVNLGWAEGSSAARVG